MNYEQALRLWGLRRLQAEYPRARDFDLESITVEMQFNEGFACCDGRDPQCCCSYAESPSANVEIRGRGRSKSEQPRIYTSNISAYDFNFARILGEIVAVGDGAITN